MSGTGSGIVLVDPDGPHRRSPLLSASLRELDAVALATNVTVFMGRGTQSVDCSVVLAWAPISSASWIIPLAL
jgi:hypothetical protein